MSSPSIGVTKVELTRLARSWVIRSPSCSARRISRASPDFSGQSLSISCSNRAARTVFWPAWLNRSKKTRSRGTSVGNGIAPAKLPSLELVGDPRRGLPVPFGRRLRPIRGALGDELRNLRDALGIEPEERVGPARDRDRPLRVVAQRVTGDPEIGR